jgi:hypothetical protein
MPGTETGNPSGTGKGITPEEQEREARKEQDGKCKREGKGHYSDFQHHEPYLFYGKIIINLFNEETQKENLC